LAHAAGAPLISNDSHLLDQRGQKDLIVLTPGEFWDRYLRSDHKDPQ
jgi:predicted nucleic acid-binding protein